MSAERALPRFRPHVVPSFTTRRSLVQCLESVGECVLVVALAAALALATYAFTASNTVPGTKAGKGEGAITGYTVSGIAYTLSASQPGEHRQRRLHAQRVRDDRQGQGSSSRARRYTDCTVTRRYQRLVQTSAPTWRGPLGRRALGRRRLVVSRRPGSVAALSSISSPRHEEVPRHSLDQVVAGRRPDSLRRGSCSPRPSSAARPRYAVVEGASMEPGLQSRRPRARARRRHARASAMSVLYRDSALGVRVLHRVIASENGRLVLQGDANDFVDDARPRPSEVDRLVVVLDPARRVRSLLWLQAAAPCRAARLRR